MPTVAWKHIDNFRAEIGHALRILRAHRVVKARRSGRMVFYGLADSHVRRLLELALAHAAHSSLVHEVRGSSDGGSER